MVGIRAARRTLVAMMAVGVVAALLPSAASAAQAPARPLWVHVEGRTTSVYSTWIQDADTFLQVRAVTLQGWVSGCTPGPP